MKIDLRLDLGTSPIRAAALAALLCFFTTASFGGSILYTSTFSDPNNAGSVGGGILSGSQSDVNINQGPWQGTYEGLLGILAAPSLQISTSGGFTGGSATVDGIAGLNVGGIINNPGWFYTNTGVGYQANTLYTLSVDVNVGGLINNLSVLSNAGVGIGLTQGGDSLYASSTDPLQLVGLSLLNDECYQLTLQFTTGNTAPSGNIGIRLFDDPAGLATANVLSDVTFSNVVLEGSSSLSPSSAVPEPASYALAGVGLLGLGLLRRRKSRDH